MDYPEYQEKLTREREKIIEETKSSKHRLKSSFIGDRKTKDSNKPKDGERRDSFRYGRDSRGRNGEKGRSSDAELEEKENFGDREKDRE